MVSTGDYWSFQTEELKEIKESNPPMFKSTWNLKVDKASAEGTPEYTLPQVQQFMDQYVRSYIKATGSQDINLVSGLIDPDGPVYEQTAEYFKELDDISLTASDLLIEVQDFQALSESTYQVTTKETYDVQYSDGSVIQGTFIAVYSLVSKDGELKVRELLGSEEQ